MNTLRKFFALMLIAVVISFGYGCCKKMCKRTCGNTQTTEKSVHEHPTEHPE